MPTMAEAEALLRPKGMLIGDSWVTTGGAGEYIHVNPSTGTPHPAIPMAGTADVDQAVQAARAAFPTWRKMPVDQRRDLLLRLAALIKENGAELAALNTLDHGSPAMMTGAAVKACADNFTYFAGWVDKVGGDVIAVWANPALDYAVMGPYGGVCVLIPWNVPVYSIGPAL